MTIVHWDKSQLQLNPCYSCDIIFITLSPGSTLAMGDKMITLISGFNYNFYPSVLADQRDLLGVIKVTPSGFGVRQLACTKAFY